MLLVWVTGEHGYWFCPEVGYGVLVRVGDVDLRQIDFQLFLQHKRVYSGSAENGSATMASHVQVPSKNGKENAFTEGKRNLGGL